MFEIAQQQHKTFAPEEKRFDSTYFETNSPRVDLGKRMIIRRIKEERLRDLRSNEQLDTPTKDLPPTDMPEAKFKSDVAKQLGEAAPQQPLPVAQFQ